MVQFAVTACIETSHHSQSGRETKTKTKDNFAVGVGNVKLLTATEETVCEYYKSNFTFDSISHFHISDGYIINDIGLLIMKC